MGVLTQFWSPRGSRFLLLKYELESRSEVPFTVGVIAARKLCKNSKIDDIHRNCLNTLNPNPTILGGSGPGILVIFENTTSELPVQF